MRNESLKVFGLMLWAGFAHTGVCAQEIVLKGSDTLGTLLVPEWVEAFQETHPKVSFDVSARGSAMGIDALIHFRIDIAASSRRALPVEFSSARSRSIILKPTIVCFDGVSVILHPSNPIGELSLHDLELIFSGAVDDWDEIGGEDRAIVPYVRNAQSGTYWDFQTLAMNRRQYAVSCRQMISNEAIIEEIASDPRGIGYVGLAFVDHPGIKVIPIDGVMPSVATVTEKTYPIWRPNFLYTDGRPRGIVAEFIDFVLSPRGQRIVEEVGFVPVR